jgi:hypothetical protein
MAELAFVGVGRLDAPMASFPTEGTEGAERAQCRVLLLAVHQAQPGPQEASPDQRDRRSGPPILTVDAATRDWLASAAQTGAGGLAFSAVSTTTITDGNQRRPSRGRTPPEERV